MRQHIRVGGKKKQLGVKRKQPSARGVEMKKPSKVQDLAGSNLIWSGEEAT
jgi:hypothetical protein